MAPKVLDGYMRWEVLAGGRGVLGGVYWEGVCVGRMYREAAWVKVFAERVCVLGKWNYCESICVERLYVLEKFELRG